MAGLDTATMTVQVLGTRFVNEKKLPGGLNYLVDEVNKLGMKFGIWMEPEMISPDSELYKEHPNLGNCCERTHRNAFEKSVCP